MTPRIAPGSIVVGVDGSEHSDRAVRWAAEQAHLERRPLVAVAVDDPDEGEITVGNAVIAARGEFPFVEAVGLVVPGDPREVLLELSHAAHLLVLGSRGRGTVRSTLLGSVSVAVTQASACPVVVCRPPHAGPGDGVVVGADGTPESLPVIEFAFAQASLRDLPLTVLHCFWDVVAAAAGFREASGEVLNDPHLEEERALLAQSVAGLSEKYPDVEVTRMLRHGLVDEALNRHGRSWDLLVVGHHPMTTPRRLVLGSIASAVLERARSTVAVVPEMASDE